MAKTVTFGEIMLRLKSPDNQRLFQSPTLEATFGGGEANVAVSLGILGKEAAFVSSVPDNSIGQGAINELRRYGVDTRFIRKEKNGRLGIYFLENGSCSRPSSVIYDRQDSCISKAKNTDFNWELILNDTNWFHVTGITPAISQSGADLAMQAVSAAKKSGVTVSLDLNYRKKLWNYGKTAPEVMCALAEKVDVLIANEEDIQKSLGINAPTVDVTKGKLERKDFKTLAEKVKAKFPNIKIVAITLRESISADKNGWSAVLSGESKFLTSKEYLIEDIVDRVGAGDAFSAGLIYGLQEYGEDEQSALEFATAASCLKHTISGDFNLSTKQEILTLMAGDSSGRVHR
ncbi:MAG: sugar kinase [Spirochaetaceae bacterium]|nr:sugar kinase [Spirochaetaceae bacterium]